MYLKRITVTGFKSFASKTMLELEPGITAIVGPNGSGKSNVADAIRWALGEQNKSRLRLNDREEVVFAGTDKRAKASFAEVVLLFDNQDGAFPLDLAEVEISRRLYRSGESDYRLAGRSAKLSDIQALMAEAGFGAGTYAVIGQGMIDSFLLSSPSERKLLFDEAAGIRASELKREASLRQLAATSTNLTRLRDITAELEPRLVSLEAGMAAAKAVSKLEEQLLRARLAYVATANASLGRDMIALTHERDELTLESHRLASEIAAAYAAQTERLAATKALRHEQAEARVRVAHLEAEQSDQTAEHARLQAALEHTRLRAGQAKDLERQLRAAERTQAKVSARMHEITEDIADNRAAASEANKALKRANATVAAAQAELLELRESLNDGTGQRYVGHALQLMKTIAQGLNDERLELVELKLLIHKAGRMLSHATRAGEAELLIILKASQSKLEAAMQRRETATEHQNNITLTRRSLQLDDAHQRGLVNQAAHDAASLAHDLAAAQAEQARVPPILDEVKACGRRLDATAGALKDVRAALAEQDPSVVDSVHMVEEAARLERARGRSEGVATRLSTLDVEAALVAEASTSLSERIRAWGVLSEPAHIKQVDVAELERTASRLEYELAARRDQVRDTALEYQQVQQRHGELATQITDLDDARTNLESLITELDDRIRRRFKDNFASLSEHFSRYFGRLFAGGVAALEIEESQDGDYGILIKASPKGKRLTNLNALSGGERAMAGVALLAAILSVNPSPFVVLDEIDAALDEANSGRLAGILDELQHRSQLIVITHNRQTMRSAASLFGVTMDEHHVSRLLSLRLEEATSLAAR